ncbi:hypothetical protein Tsp_09770 [Trichinella spiralis]|uniref:hypothetical protein n=1 Tax=Trichinella spiralis TaxID=6334 RepID=UPI0001EFD93F|nr:hypothetical protein Tsp_09770 [Trichinella spiralis]
MQAVEETALYERKADNSIQQKKIALVKSKLFPYRNKIIFKMAKARAFFLLRMIKYDVFDVSI